MARPGAGDSIQMNEVAADDFGEVNCDANVSIFFVLLLTWRVLITEGDLFSVFGLESVFGVWEMRCLDECDCEIWIVVLSIVLFV